MMKSLFLALIAVLLLSCQTDSRLVDSKPEAGDRDGDMVNALPLPDRPADAATGSEIAARIAALSLEEREKAVVREVLSGNVPSFARVMKPVIINRIIEAKQRALTVFSVCDYLAVGSDQDYLYMPMTPATAQYLADRLNSSLPTKKLVDVIYRQAGLKLSPQPIPPSDKMTTVPVFAQHTDSIKQQIAQAGFERSAGEIVAGHKKDIIISNKIYSPDRSYDRVVIYGWHRSENHPIQPVYNGHYAGYADYSHGVRLIAQLAVLDGDSVRVADILTDPDLAPLLSDEGVIAKPYYPRNGDDDR